MNEAQFEMMLADARNCLKVAVRDLDYRMLNCAKGELSRTVGFVDRLLALQEDK